MLLIFLVFCEVLLCGGRRSRDRMVVVFTTLQLPMQSVPITTDVVGSNFDLIKLVCDLRQIGGSPNKTDRHDITEILLKVALNTIKQQTNKHPIMYYLRSQFRVEMSVTIST